MSDIPRPEYPRMQFVRKEYLNLNGQWSYEFDFSESGIDDPATAPLSALNSGWNDGSNGLLDQAPYSNMINVPFCPESRLSGVEHKDFIPAMFYARKVIIPGEWQNKRIIIHFGGVDNVAGLFIDGRFAGRHKGGQGSFEFDITSLVTPGSEHLLVLHVTDHLRQGLSGRGKQSYLYKSCGCLYTRVTGIWSTVWLEAVAVCGLKRCRITPDFDNGSFVFTPEYYACDAGNQLEVEISADGQTVAKYRGICANGVPFGLKPEFFRAWTPDDPFLYDIKLRVFDRHGELIDEVDSYSGLRKISIVKDRIYLNNQPFFPRFVLDQGYYPDGIWTAPDDETLQNDILLSKAAGFNGARLHQKVFDERFHYHADRLGYLTWGEYGSWGLNFSNAQARENFLAEWREIIQRDINHPSIIFWSPLNETVPPLDTDLAARFPNQEALITYRDFISELVDLTKALDPTRPVSDTSGFIHVKSDIWSVHPYCKDVETLKEKLLPADGGVMHHAPQVETGYCGQPYLCNEFGGFMYIPPERRNAGDRWGYYGMDLKTPEDLCARIREQVEFLVNTSAIGGYCYTQLTDVEQEQNGIYNYDRTPKFPVGMIREIFSIKPDWSKY